MSLNIDKKKGVKLKTSKKNGKLIFAVLLIIEGIFTFFLYLSLAGKIFAPPTVQSAAGVPDLISYQGRLTDTSGNPLGGTGTVYCFRYYLYDSATSTTQIWPLNSASSTNSTTTVTDGVFSDQIGRVDTLATQDFMSSSTLFLQVQVTTSTCTTGSFENLSPRQQIISTGFAQTASNVYGAALKTTTSTKVQVGLGTGQVSGYTLLTLDWSASTTQAVGNTCSNPGSLWYNSQISRALVCEGTTLQAISNASTTIASIGTNGTSTLITSGNVVFSASANITLSQTGNTIQISGPAAAAALPTFLTYQNRQLGASALLLPTQNAVWITPMRVAGGNVSASTIVMMERISGAAANMSSSSGNFSQTVNWAIYSNNTTNSTRMDTWASGSFSMSLSHTGISFTWGLGGATGTLSSTAIAGLKLFTIPLNSSITPGLYAWGFAVSTAAAGSSPNSTGFIIDSPMLSAGGVLSNAVNASIGYVDAGTWTVTSGAMPSSIALTDIVQVSNQVPYFKAGAL